MARIKMVTRTIVETTATVLAMDTTSATVVIPTYTIGGEYETNDKLLKKLQAIYETDSFKLVSVQSVSTEEKLLGMTEDDFIKYATVLPPRTKADDNE